MKTERNKRLYNIWACMKQRCNNPKHTAAAWYHDRGITVCKEWNNDFFAFQSWALSSGYADGLTIDRIDPDGNYTPDNCRWITRSENLSRARHTDGKRIRASGSVKSRKGRYEVWFVRRYLLSACVVATGLMYSEALKLERSLSKEHHLNCGEYYVVRKPEKLRAVGTHFYCP